MKIVFIFRLFGKSAWTVKNPNRSRYVILGFGWVGFHVLLTLISVISRLGSRRYSIFEIELARPGFELRTSRARAGHTAFRYTCIFVLEDFNIDFLELEPSAPALLRLCIAFLRSPKGGRCSISDDLSCSSIFLYIRFKLFHHISLLVDQRVPEGTCC